MEGLLLFDLATNDLIYKHLNEEMEIKLRNLVTKMDLVRENETDKYLNSNVIMQVFSPLITSQRIMCCQFDNSYTHINCEEINIVFEEFLGFLFLKLDNKKSLEYMQRFVGVSIFFIKHICGASVHLLKTDINKSNILTNLLITWSEAYSTSQSIMLETIEQLLINQDVKGTVGKTLQDAISILKQDPHSQKCHALIFVGNKFLSLHSSRQAQQLATSDLVFLDLYCQSLKTVKSDKKLDSHLIFLQGQAPAVNTGCIPHILHIIPINQNMKLLLLVEFGNNIVANGLNDVFFLANKIKNLQMQENMETLKPAYENLDIIMRQVTDAIKKIKYNNHEIEESMKNLLSKWDSFKKKYLDMLKAQSVVQDQDERKNELAKVESYLPFFMDAIKDFFRLTCLECNTIDNGTQRVLEIAAMVEAKLAHHADFLEVKAKRNFSLSSYLEEFAGLVHFIYIDRQNGRLISPNIDVTAEETSSLVKKKVWEMVECSRSYLLNGQLSVIWKDFAFSYSFFMWFEDQNGQVLKPKDHSSFASNATPKSTQIPGVMAHDYYEQLIDTYFSKAANNSNKIKCFELYCIHLGLVTPSCVLEHSRRLAATINDVTDMSSHNPFDLL